MNQNQIFQYQFTKNRKKMNKKNKEKKANSQSEDEAADTQLYQTNLVEFRVFQ